MENSTPRAEAQGSTKISVSDSKGQPTEVSEDSIGQISPAQTTSVTPSKAREVQCNVNAPIQVDKLTDFLKYSESPSLAGPLTSTSSTSGSSVVPAPISQSQISQQLAFKGPDLCSTPKLDNSSTKQMENKSLPSGDSLALNMPSTVYSGYSTIDNAFSPLFSSEPDNIFGSKSLGPLDMPGQSQESESDKGTSGIGFSLFGDSISQQEESSNFFSFDFGGSSTHTEDRSSTSRGVFSLFGSDSADNSEDSVSGANFRLF
ncbi:mucin-21-like isoform X2 [Macrobrachium rosenbergii]|uniref:mucin-21-like isoform X2 n=1 Tax=Macrobrachium rosenbergii TaxID=79674 RepID=UPI0034D5EF5E